MSKHEEEALQMACVKWFHLQYPNVIIHHSPNGGERAVKTNKNGVKYCPEGLRFKKMGTVAGFPDLFIARSNHFWNGLFIEMKDPNGKGKISDEQKEMIERLTMERFKAVICNSLDEFINIVNEYLK